MKAFFDSLSEKDRRRYAAIEAEKLGHGGIEYIARVLGCNPRTIQRGRSDLEQPPSDDMSNRIRKVGAGRPPTLSDAQIVELERLLLQGATAHGWVNSLWTYQRVAELIRKHFGVSLCTGTVRTTLKNRMGWTCQKPRQQIKERDEDEIRRWKTEEFDHIKSEASRRNAYLAFVDESGFMLAPTRRRTLAPSGRAPIVDVTDPHARISAIAAIAFSPKRRCANLQFQLLPDNANFNGASVTTFLS